ncbi:putative short-chain dehydrogenase reductase [Diaporthe ampelina]|uniref:Putative short-chain dehydrogenase reductase n=1 Tax=Diaporthe ampelina TaxID=1214573 RepID=A0A0G2HXL8_9PEZI|nr:putative short-chain dehydrogenase reductase [Diaporthe ampelina]
MWPFSSKGFTANDIPDLSGKVILVTGANSGLGLQSVLDLARHGPKEIWLASRTTDKADQAIQEIKKEVPGANLKPLSLDLTSFDSIRSAARSFTQSSQRLDVLLLNAGIMASGAGLTKDGYEVQFGTNHVGHALLTKLLAPVLDRTAAEPGSDVRVVVLTSAAVAMAPQDGIEFDTLKTEQEPMGAWTRYGQSKLANALFARQLAKLHPTWTVSAIHPGVVTTNLMRHVQDRYWWAKGLMPITNVLFTTVQQGALNQLWGATAPKGDIKSGEMYFPVADLTGGRRGPYVKDDALASKLWDWTEQELKGQDL